MMKIAALVASLLLAACGGSQIPAGLADMIKAASGDTAAGCFYGSTQAYGVTTTLIFARAGGQANSLPEAINCGAQTTITTVAAPGTGTATVQFPASMTVAPAAVVPTPLAAPRPPG